MNITPAEARAELARRELARRRAKQTQEEPDYSKEYAQPEGVNESFLSKLPRNLAIGLANLGHETLNTPYNLTKGAEDVFQGFSQNLNEAFPMPEAVQQRLQQMPKREQFKLSEHIPRQQGYNFAEMLGQKGTPTLMDTLIQKGIEYTPEIALGLSLARHIPGVSKLASRAKELTKKGSVKQNLEALEKENELFGESQQPKEEEYQALKNFLEQRPGYASSNPNILERKATEMQQKQERLRNETEQTPENLRATEYPEEPETTPLSLVQAEKANEIPISSIEKPMISEKPIKEAESLFQTAAQKRAALEAQQSENLRKGYLHDVPIAEQVVAEIEGVKNPKTGKMEGGKKQEIGQMFKDVENELKDQNILIEDENAIKQIDDATKRNMDLSKPFFENDEEFKKALAHVTETKGKTGGITVLPASNALSNYQTLRHLAQKMRTKAYSREVAGNKALHEDMLAKASEMQANADKIESLLENHLEKTGSADVLSNLKAAKARWLKEIVPLYKNPVYQRFLARGQGAANLMEALRGKEAGNVIVKDIIKKNPELLKNIIGQVYAENPAKLHEFSELSQEYLQHMPELQEWRRAHFEAKQTEQAHKMAVEKAKHEHKLQQESANLEYNKKLEEIKQHNRIAKEEAEEKTRLKKVETQKENKRLKEEHKQKKAYYEAKKELDKLEKEIPELRAHIKKLQEHAKNKEISLKEKLSRESKIEKEKKRLASIEKDRDAIKKWVKRGAYLGGGVLLGEPVVSKLMDKILGKNS